MTFHPSLSRHVHGAIRVPAISRRAYLTASVAAAATSLRPAFAAEPNRPKQIAAVVTGFRHRSHAHGIVGRWLEGFAYPVALGPLPFVLAGGLALAVALLTVGAQALRAAQADPVEALRYE